MIIQNPSEHYIPNAMYYAFKQLPELEHEAYAYVCLEVALNFSEDAQKIYSGIVQTWELPGCQLLINDFVKFKPDTRDWLRTRAKAIIKNKPQPEHPKFLIELMEKVKDDTDCYKLAICMTYLIRYAFNRKEDIENLTPKVIADKSPYLVQAITFYSLLDYLESRPELKGPKVISENELTEFRSFFKILGEDPNQRDRRYLVSIIRQRGFRLHNNNKIFEQAMQWYKCRVNPGTIEGYLDELASLDTLGEKPRYPDRGRIENDIAPFDLAIGYPRQWRK